MANFLVFAGTSEGRTLVELLDRCGETVCACVATEYGKSLLPESVRVFSERLDAQEMTSLLQSLRFDCVIDATHPYAREVTQNIQTACETAQVHLMRLLRPAERSDGCVYVEDVAQAVEVLAATTGNVLLTTGSRDLDQFVNLPNYQERLFVRVLPVVPSLQRCQKLGYQTANIIAMQGPFSCEMNAAMLRQINAKILVTKESGIAGGFLEKMEAAQKVGATAVVIGRPNEEQGFLWEELLDAFAQQFGVTFPVEPIALPYTSQEGIE